MLAHFKNEEYTLYSAYLCSAFGLRRFMQTQMAYRSAVYFSIGTIGTNGTNRQIVYAWPRVVNVCSLQMVYQSTNNSSIGIDLYQWYQSTRLLWRMVISLPMVRLERVFWRLVSVCVYWTCVSRSPQYYRYFLQSLVFHFDICLICLIQQTIRMLAQVCGLILCFVS